MRGLARLRHHIRFSRHAGRFGRDATLRWLVGLPMQFDLTIDVGAHHGLYAQALASKSAAVIVIEPRPNAQGHLAAVLPVHCRTVCIALSDQIGRLDLSTPVRRGVPDFALTTARAAADFGTTALKWSAGSTTLDCLIDEMAEGRRVGFVKIDVEGHEMAVLRGAPRTLATHRPLVLLEAERRHGSDVAAVFAAMTAFGYVGSLPRSGPMQPVSPAAFLEYQAATGAGTRGYVNNVLFLPEERATYG